MRSFFAGLTSAQQKAALEYSGEENMMVYRSIRGRGAGLSNAEGLAQHSNFVAKVGVSRSTRIKQLEAEVAQLKSERNKLREELTRMQNAPLPRS